MKGSEECAGGCVVLSLGVFKKTDRAALRPRSGRLDERKKARLGSVLCGSAYILRSGILAECHHREFDVFWVDLHKAFSNYPRSSA